MRSLFGRPKAMPPVNFRRLAAEIHSVAKQAPFRIAFRVDLGGQELLKIDEISSFGALRFAFAFWVAKLMISGGPQS